MALPEPTPFNEVVVHVGRMADVSATTSAFAACPVKGRLVRGYSCLGGAISAADATWTVEVNGVAVTGTCTIANASSAAGDVDEVEFTGGAVDVNQGDTLEIVPGGESSTTATCDFFLVIRT
jgi:hypothetical protein